MIKLISVPPFFLYKIDESEKYQKKMKKMRKMQVRLHLDDSEFLH
jgi:hypothetical protein